MNLNCLSHWFPKLESAGLPVPRTEVVKTDVKLIRMLGGEKPNGFDSFLSELTAVAEKIGLPCFLRTGQTSGKHSWNRTCYVTDASKLASHVLSLAEFSECCSLLGLPYNVWAVRELLPTDPAFHVYQGMPVVREFRCFVDGPELVCVHPYWPKTALIDGFPLSERVQLDDALERRDGRDLPPDFDRTYQCLCSLPANDTEAVHGLARRAGVALGGQWSVDILETRKGWFVTDCAVARDSFHWDGCANASRFT